MARMSFTLVPTPLKKMERTNAMEVIQLTAVQPDDLIVPFVEGHLPPSAGDYTTLITAPCTVLKPNGDPLLTFLPRHLDLADTETAFTAFADKLRPKVSSFRKAISSSSNDGSEGVWGW